MIGVIIFINKFNLKNKATTNIKSYQVLSSIGLDNVRTSSRDGPIECEIGMANLHPKTGTQWMLYINEIYFDSYGCAPPQKFSEVIIKP